MDGFVADVIFIDAPPGDVFAAILDPRDILVWMDAENAVVEPEQGGLFKVERMDGSKVTGHVSRLEPDRELEIEELYHEEAGERRGPMRVCISLEPRDNGVWLTVRQDGLGTGKDWAAFNSSTRREWVRATVALKRHIEQI